MVLKVVGGKILETLELGWFAAAAIGFLMLCLEAGAGSKCFTFIRMGLGWPRFERVRRELRCTLKKLSSAPKI